MIKSLWNRWSFLGWRTFQSLWNRCMSLDGMCNRNFSVHKFYTPSPLFFNICWKVGNNAILFMLQCNQGEAQTVITNNSKRNCFARRQQPTPLLYNHLCHTDHRRPNPQLITAQTCIQSQFIHTCQHSQAAWLKQKCHPDERWSKSLNRTCKSTHFIVVTFQAVSSSYRKSEIIFPIIFKQVCNLNCSIKKYTILFIINLK